MAPSLERNVFNMCHNTKNLKGPNLEYWGRVIHFGANLKSVESELNEWIVKYEQLLSSLLWLESKVHFQTEYSALQTLSWRVDLHKYSVKSDDTFPSAIDKSHWIFESTWNFDTKAS